MYNLHIECISKQNLLTENTATINTPWTFENSTHNEHSKQWRKEDIIRKKCLYYHWRKSSEKNHIGIKVSLGDLTNVT